MKISFSFALLIVFTLSCHGFEPEISARLTPRDIPDEDEELRTIRFSYGLNLGLYVANDANAGYYSGSGTNDLNQAINRTHTYDRIRESLGYDFSLHQLPANMGYSPAMLVGVFGTIYVSERTGIHGSFNFTSLSADDQFTLELKKPSFIEGDNIQRYPIAGREERSEIMLGMKHTYVLAHSIFHPYMEAGASMSNTRIKDHRISIEGRRYSIQSPRDAYYDIRDDGIGFGVYAGGGVRIDLGDAYAASIGMVSNYARINLGENQNYHLQFTAFIRLFLSAAR